MAGLSPDEIELRLVALPEWRVKGDKITRTFKFRGFRWAVAFVEVVADLAEEANHHPDILILYDKVTLRLKTYDEDAITEKDFAPAKRIDDAFAAEIG